MGGIVIGHEVGARPRRPRHLRRARRRRARRCGAASRSTPRERVLVVEDVVTTGKSTRETMTWRAAPGATVVGGGVDRRPQRRRRPTRRARSSSLADDRPARPRQPDVAARPCAQRVAGQSKPGRSRPGLRQLSREPRVPADAGLRRHRVRGLAAPGDGASVQAAARGGAGAARGGAGHVTGAGRTDAGVQPPGRWPRRRCAAASTPATRSCGRINARLPADIRVAARRAMRARRFHARFSRRRKTYRYRIWNGAASSTLRCARTHWHVLAAARRRRPWRRPRRVLGGTHDFAAFQATGSTCQTTIRTVTVLDSASGRAPTCGLPLADSERLVVLEIARRRLPAPHGAGHRRHAASRSATARAPADIGRASLGVARPRARPADGPAPTASFLVACDYAELTLDRPSPSLRGSLDGRPVPGRM